MASIQEDIEALQTKEEALTASNAKMANFAYTTQAYTNNDVEGKEDYVPSRAQNIPSANPEILQTAADILARGFRSQGSSLPRQLMNHFFGRASYNLNKIHDNFYAFLTSFKSYLGADNGIATLDENGRIPYSQQPESAINFIGYWNASDNTTDNPSYASLIDGTGLTGEMFICDTEGWFDAATGTASATEVEGYEHYFVNDRIIYTNGTWSRLPAGDVKKVNDQSPTNGNVHLTGENIPISSTNPQPLSSVEAIISSVIPRGLVIPFAGEFGTEEDPYANVPAGFLACDGHEISRTTYANLFSIIGVRYGGGDGINTFNVPDCREVVLVGAGQSTIHNITAHDVYGVGWFKDDQFQGHRHRWGGSRNEVGGNQNTIYKENEQNVELPRAWITTGPITDDVNGNPRTGTTTHGKQLGVNFIIKF